MKTCKVEWPNVWTSAGKSMRGDEITLPDDEVDALKELGAVSVKRGRKAEKKDEE